MSVERPHNGGSTPRSWFERLSLALLGEPKDREQLVTLLRDAQQRNLLDPDALGMIEGVLQVSEMHVRDIQRPSVFIPESNRLYILLKEFLANHKHKTFVVDEYGGVAGLVTIED